MENDARVYNQHNKPHDRSSVKFKTFFHSVVIYPILADMPMRPSRRRPLNIGFDCTPYLVFKGLIGVDYYMP